MNYSKQKRWFIINIFKILFVLVSWNLCFLIILFWKNIIAYIIQEKTFLKYALHMFRQSILKNYTEDLLLRVSKEESEFLKNFSKFITGNNILSFMKTFNDGHYFIERNANPKLLFTNICFQVMRYIHMA